MMREGRRMRPKINAARPTLSAAMIRFCAVTRTEQAQQSREPLSSRADSFTALPAIEYGGGTTTSELNTFAGVLEEMEPV